MPSEDVSDLRDVVDAINKLCETMKNSNYEDTESNFEDCGQAEMEQIVEPVVVEVEPEQVVVHQVDTLGAEKWCDSIVEEVSETEQPVTVCEPGSEYHTASSEVSLTSEDMCQVNDKAVHAASEPSLQPDEVGVFVNEDAEQRDDRNSVMAGHVAAMRERFESMTRTNTPCPDALRSASPSVDICRTITPSPDLLDKS